MSENYEELFAAEMFTMLRGIRMRWYLLVSHWDSWPCRGPRFI